jgi:cytochrome b-561
MYQWLDDRLSIGRLYAKAFRKAFPVHHSFFLGEITLFAFITLVLTGIFLTFNYEPSIRPVSGPLTDFKEVPAAYYSILYIDSLPFGAVIRSLHHWAAHIMIAAAFLHMLRIHLTGAYKNPRELNWIIGVFLLVLSVLAAFTGYALPYDNYSFTATLIGYEIGAAAPWVGGIISNILFGGAMSLTNTHMIPRLYAIHVLWLPLIMGALIALHLTIMIKQKHTQPKYAEKLAPGRIVGVPLFPQQAAMMGVLFLVFLAVSTFIAGGFLAHPVQAYGPPTIETPAVKPDWYFMWIFGILQMIPATWSFEFLGATFGPQFWGGILAPTIIILGALAIPFLDYSKSKQRYLELPSRHPVRTSFVIGMVMFYLMSTMAGYKTGLGLTIGQLWVLVLVVPTLTGLVSYIILRAVYGKDWNQETDLELKEKGSAADD